MKTSGCIQNDNIVSVLLRIGNRLSGDLHRLVIRSHGKDIHFLLLSVDLQLFDCRRSVNITGNQQGFLSLGFQLSGKLCRRRRLTGTLKTRHHDYRDRFAGLHGNFRGLASHQGDHLFVYDLDDHLPRIQSVHNVLTDSALLHRLDELLYHLEVDIRLQKCHLYFLERRLDVFLCKPSLAAQVFKHSLKFIC